MLYLHVEEQKALLNICERRKHTWQHVRSVEAAVTLQLIANVAKERAKCTAQTKMAIPPLSPAPHVEEQACNTKSVLAAMVLARFSL